jgi:hypothetical protein
MVYNKFMKKLIFLVPFIFLTSCKTPCSDTSSLATKTSDFVIAKWQCKNESAVRHDITKWMASKNLCVDENQRGLVSGIVCPFVAGVIRKTLASKVPKEWECQEDLIGKDAAIAFSAICGLIPY